MDELRQFVPVSGRFIGIPPNTDRDYVNWCPECGGRIPDDDSTRGYGFAHGGGIGHYVFCCNPACGWFYKELDATEKGGS
jgi:hypothetical protein